MKTVAEIYAEADGRIIDQICEMSSGVWVYQNQIAAKLDVKESWLCRFMDKHEKAFLERSDCPAVIRERVDRRRWR